MKKIIQLLTCCLLVLAATSCSQGAAAIDKAYDQACKAEPAEKVATTLCNGDIKCLTLTSDEITKLGAVLNYITFNGLYTANFEDQVDMYQFGNLLDSYREAEKNFTGTERLKIEELTKNILVTSPEACPPPAPGAIPPPAPSDTCAQAPGAVPPPSAN